MEIDDKAGTALVEFNGMKFRLPTERLKIAPKIEEKRKSGSEYIKFNIQTKLDLRGMRAEESIMELEKFLSEAILSNADFLTIIHGKGTGVLRQVVHEFLNKFPQVVSFRLGEINEGGSGVTIVSL